MNIALPTVSPGAWLVPVVDWLNLHWHGLFAAITAGVGWTLDTLLALLLLLPPYGTIAVITVAALLIVGWKPAAVALGTLLFCWAVGMWQDSMNTITLVVVSVVIAVLIAFPLGVLAARQRWLEVALRPILDVMQTVPPWVYLIPAVILFNLGRVPAIIATIVYAAPPMVRITTLAFKQVPKEFRELGLASGARPLTALFKVEMPLAKPTLLVGLNQCILLSLAMVVLAGLVGASGLGGQVTRGLTRMELGLGLRSGLGIVAVAILLDRLSRAILTRQPQRLL